MTRIKRGLGKVEFLAILPDVRKMLTEGFNVSMVYRHFLEQGKITMSSRSFFLHSKKYFPDRSKQSVLPALPLQVEGIVPPKQVAGPKEPDGEWMPTNYTLPA